MMPLANTLKIFPSRSRAGRAAAWRRFGRFQALGWGLGLGLLVILGTPNAGWAVDTQPATLEHDGSLRQLLEVVRDPQATLIRRRHAASLLLASGQAEMWSSLKLELGTSVDPITPRAIAQALALSNRPPVQFAPLLLDMLTSCGEPLLADVAIAMGRYPEPEFVQRLIELANNPRVREDSRKAAILSLSQRRSQQAIGGLMGLIELHHPAAIREAALGALARSTGLTELGSDRLSWQQWWRQHRDLTPDAWNQALFENFSRTRTELVGMVRQLQDRLVDSQRQLYRATPADKRAAILVSLMGDPLEALRQLGMELTLQMLTEVGPAAMPATVRTALLERLEDPSVAVRLRAALLMRDLTDETGAEKVAGLLASGQEQRPELLRAYLLVATRLPRAKAIEPALKFLGDPYLRIHAADMLSAAFDARLLTNAQQQRALDQLRQANDNQPPEPAIIGLLGRLGKDSHWRNILVWLEHSDPKVREAAALALARSERSLVPLMRMSDQNLALPILLEAAARRGTEPAVLEHIARNRPTVEPNAELWRRSLLAMAGRVPPQATLNLDNQLASQQELADLRLRILSASLEHWLPELPAPATAPASQLPPYPVTQPADSPPDAMAPVVDLLLRRSELRLASNDPRSTLNDLQRLVTHRLPMSVVQQRQWGLLGLKTRTTLGETEGLLEPARKAMLPDAQGAKPSAPAVADMLIQAVRRSATANQMDRARTILLALKELVAAVPEDHPLPSSVSETIKELEVRTGLLPAPTTAPAPGTAPATVPEITPTTAPGTAESGTTAPANHAGSSPGAAPAHPANGKVPAPPAAPSVSPPATAPAVNP